MPRLENYWRNKQNVLRMFDQEKAVHLIQKKAQLNKELESLLIELSFAEDDLTAETKNFRIYRWTNLSINIKRIL